MVIVTQGYLFLISSRYAGAMKIYTRKGDDGTTGLLFGGRANKDAAAIELNGAVDEAQASLGWARSLQSADAPLNKEIAEIERDLWILMAEVATQYENRIKLEEGTTKVSQAMVDALEARIDYWSHQVEMPKEFVVPGENQQSAALDVARTVVRRAERIAVAWAINESLVVAYLNRLSDLVWTLARVAEGPQHRTARSMAKEL
jgi:cob(I)alamin adenosyltransferase